MREGSTTITFTGDRQFLDVAEGYAQQLSYMTNTYDSFKRGTGRAAGSHRSDRGGNEAVQAPDEQHRIWRCHE